MSKKKNRFGLTRDVPADIARIIRKECGFGCLICGDGFYDYEHIDPTFNNAREHDPQKWLFCAALITFVAHEEHYQNQQSKGTPATMVPQRRQ
jgi:hypothetical protein